MHENWLQEYIVAHYRGLGFSQLKGPFRRGVDFKGIYRGKRVKIEAEWHYANYCFHQHPPDWADILIVATLEPVPEKYRDVLPSRIVNIPLDEVIKWAEPKADEKERECFRSYPWRRLSRNLLDLYVYYLECHARSATSTVIGSHLALSRNKAQKPAGFLFGQDGLELAFEGTPEDKFAWDYWLNVAHSVAESLELKPAMFRPTWVDRLGLELIERDQIGSVELERLKPIVELVESLLSESGHAEQPKPMQH